MMIHSKNMGNQIAMLSYLSNDRVPNVQSKGNEHHSSCPQITLCPTLQSQNMTHSLCTDIVTRLSPFWSPNWNRMVFTQALRYASA